MGDRRFKYQVNGSLPCEIANRAITRMRHILLSAAKGLADGKEPPALGGEFNTIRGAEKILEPGEDCASSAPMTTRSSRRRTASKPDGLPGS